MFSRVVENVLLYRSACKCVQIKHFSSLIQTRYKVPNDSETEPSALEKASQDLSEFTPYYPKSFNLAAYVNSSETLQKLIQLNVNLSKIETKPYHAEQLLKLDFDRNIKEHLLFLKDFVNFEELGSFITKNSLILSEPLEDLKIRINYLQSKCFSEDQIKQIITRNPFWLMFTTTRIDRRLGFYQDKFLLHGKEVRLLASKQPKLITYSLHNVRTNMFALKEEMGFEQHELKQLLLKKPRLYMISQKTLLERFNYIHNTMQISHKRILDEPAVLLSRNFRIKQRHLFLQKLGRAQYDPKKENYVPIIKLAEGSDTEFCKQEAKCNVLDYNLFLKTL
ncbi:transcription termination factor 3, mitochondrial [Cydia strobilella]|uniref:transcription termination factor 3, mitochondrial n=1 Tax=Cydia strobilella TaxID=1100964 RepID=UPI00300571C6